MSDSLPTVVKPMLAQSSPPFDSPEHLFEPKWDGIRCLLFAQGATKLQSRNLRDLTPLFPELAQLHTHLEAQGTILDGELVVIKEGKAQFAGIQKRLTPRRPGVIDALSHSLPATYVAFDLLYYEGRPLLQEPLYRRKEYLAKLFQPGPSLIVSPYVFSNGIQLHEACKAQAFEGSVAKLLKSPYLPGQRSRVWLKNRIEQEVDCVILGYTKQENQHSIGALLLGVATPAGFRYIGSVGTGFDQQVRQTLFTVLGNLERDTPPAPVPQAIGTGAHWVHPVLVCAVRYLEVTPQGFLRHPVFVGLRQDKGPKECLEAQLWTVNK